MLSALQPERPKPYFTGDPREDKCNIQLYVAVSVLSPEGKPRIKQNSPCPVDQGLDIRYWYQVNNYCTHTELPNPSWAVLRYCNRCDTGWLGWAHKLTIHNVHNSTKWFKARWEHHKSASEEGPNPQWNVHKNGFYSRTYWVPLPTIALQDQWCLKHRD